MPQEENKCSCSENRSEVGSVVGTPMEISPEALELLQNAVVPSEFLEIARRSKPPRAGLCPPAPGVPADMEEGSSDEFALEMPVQPEAILTTAMPLSRLETVSPSSTAFYLSDLTLNLSSVAHMTPGLLELADCPLRRLMRFFCGDESKISEAQIEEARRVVEDLMKLGNAQPVTKEQFDLYTLDPITNNRSRFIVDHQSAALGGISFRYITNPDCCFKYCWVQVLRHVFRDKILSYPIVVRDFRKFNPLDEDKSPSGYPDLVRDGPIYRKDQTDRQTGDGYVMDGHSNKHGQNPICQLPSSPIDKMDIYMDAPLFEDIGFSVNEDDKQRPLLLLISEYETCVRCDNPQTNFFACFKWYFVKIRGDGENPFGRCYLEVPPGNRARTTPSKNFLQAVRNWQQ